MRWDYDQIISSINTDKAASKNKTDILEIILKDNLTQITTQNTIISWL